MRGRPPILEHPNINAGSEPSPVDGAPSCPSSLIGEAKEKWDELLPLLLLAGTVDKLLADHLESYCVVYARLKEADRKVDEQGAVLYKKNKKGSAGPGCCNPQLWVANKCMEQLQDFGKLLGIDKASRARMGATPERSGRPVVAVRDRKQSSLPPPESAIS